MSGISRRKLLATGLAATAGVSGLATAARLARRYGLVPPDGGGVYGAGATLTYAAQRLLTTHSLAREFPRGMISKAPFANVIHEPLNDEFNRLQAGGFADWKLTLDGMFARPVSLSLSDLKRLPMRSQITQLVCEEGWSFIAEWIGTSLAEVLNASGLLPQARYIVYSSVRGYWDSIDMADALHPQTLLTWAMNDGELPVAFGGPLRLRVPRQLGYKSGKFINRLTATDSLKHFGSGLGSDPAEFGYSWYAGI